MSAGKKALFVYGHPAQADGPPAAPELSGLIEVVDQYALTPERLDRAAALILTMHNDQRWLAECGDVITGFVRAGGTLVIQGQIALAWADFLTPYRPIARPRMDQLTVRAASPHPIFEGIDREGLNIRKGVRGFYARGYNPPPEGARIVHVIADDLPVDWEWPCGAGVVFMHSGNDLWSTYEDRRANLDLARRLISWAVADRSRA